MQFVEKITEGLGAVAVFLVIVTVAVGFRPVAHVEKLQTFHWWTRAPFAEMRGRIKEDDSSLADVYGPYAYFSKYREGGDLYMPVDKTAEPAE